MRDNSTTTTRIKIIPSGPIRHPTVVLKRAFVATEKEGRSSVHDAKKGQIEGYMIADPKAVDELGHRFRSPNDHHTADTLVYRQDYQSVL